ncbi:hypothetical protein VTO73DRAFT_12079 [Trametes versicolor]
MITRRRFCLGPQMPHHDKGSAHKGRSAASGDGGSPAACALFADVHAPGTVLLASCGSVSSQTANHLRFEHCASQVWATSVAPAILGC